MDPLQLEVVTRWRGAYGRLLTVAAEAMREGRASRDAVRYALGGDGRHVHLEPVRRQRAVCNGMLAAAIGEMVRRYGITQQEAIRECTQIAVEIGEAVEAEWDVVLPIVRVAQ